MRRAKNALAEKLLGELATKNGWECFGLRQWNVAIMGAKGRQVAGTGARGKVALALAGKAWIGSHKNQKRQQKTQDKHRPQKAMSLLFAHIFKIYKAIPDENQPLIYASPFFRTGRKRSLAGLTKFTNCANLETSKLTTPKMGIKFEPKGSNLRSLFPPGRSVLFQKYYRTLKWEEIMKLLAGESLLMLALIARMDRRFFLKSTAFLGGSLVVWSLLGGRLGAAELKPYEAKDFSRLKGMKGFSNQLLEQHFALYQGYVKNTNLLLEQLAQMAKQGQTQTPVYAELKRRLGWEFDGMRLHELYFGNLGGNGEINKDGKLAKLIAEQFGSFDAWSADFKAVGAMRGIGWAVLYQDGPGGLLTNAWINEHDVGHLVGGQPLLIMDVFEHAYMTDYGVNRSAYIEAFFKNIDWAAVESRLSS